MKPLKFIIFTFLILNLTSCLTVGRIKRNCDKFATVCVTATETQTVYRDTTVYIHDTIRFNLPADTVKLTDTIRIINNRAYLPPVYKRFGLVWASAKVVNNVLDLQAGLTKTELLKPVHDTIYIEKAIQEKKITNTVTVTKKHIPKIYKIAFWVLNAFGFLLLAWIIIRAKFKKLYKFIMNILNVE